jgi:hypothetical protein
MARQISKKSILRSLQTILKQFHSTITAEEYVKIRDLVDKAEYDCCKPVKVFWIGAPTPADYQLQFKDADGNILAQTATSGNGQLLVVPARSATVCVNVINTVSLNTGSYEVIGDISYSKTGADTVAQHCDSSASTLENIYIFTSLNGACP